MKIIYTLVVIGAIGLIALLLWSERPQILSSAETGQVGWYRSHPQALANENVKCWRLLRAASFADVDRVMAEHPRCQEVYHALYGKDSATDDNDEPDQQDPESDADD
ncbi:hypothetical protein [Acidithiobacillus caldus]|uniref:Uncharacterized protein n=1 Tax=Acidithiobacillus caldus TaxID=33059 RepID=A0A1E7YMI0_9PROT|nr:hypothetical protein [Acidithiobacillus caldus]OFC35179.1 hypothetical protein BAE27_07840 [Acidithiobacillus caldus]OFC38513.1 hypothetical protein BAE28_05270 [Acidithiobacillus caldus]OFC41705.1 hypothetical protein BAE29_01980 [Acidithiobacillus caldus]